ncbi:MAG: 30S ribosomal protein S20 [Acidobacteria bacterium]|nr:30S ribosomal protein S20 [Acidobacteriota bacterium]
MPTHKSAEKRMRQSEKRRQINKRNKSFLRSQLKKVRQKIAAGDVEGARQMLPEVHSVIDRSVAKGVLHRNAAARHKSRLTQHLQSQA